MYRISQLIASADIGLRLNGTHTLAVDFLQTPATAERLTQLCAAGLHKGQRLTLHFYVHGNDPVPAIAVYLNAEHDNRLTDAQYVGALALYGLGESSAPSHGHDGSGQHRILNVGEAFTAACKRSNWSEERFTLTVVPDHAPDANAEVTIDRVEVYWQEE